MFFWGLGFCCFLKARLTGGEWGWGEVGYVLGFFVDMLTGWSSGFCVFVLLGEVGWAFVMFGGCFTGGVVLFWLGFGA